jgi:hypothetical protein
MPKSQCILKPREDYLLDRTKRLSGRRPRVTFLVGFHCFDGLVLCGDSEEGDGVNKRYVDKIYCESVPLEREVCFGGAGDSIGIAKFKEKLLGIVKAGVDSRIAVELAVEKVLQHMKDMYPEGAFSLLFSQSDATSGEAFLYRTYDNTPELLPIDQGDFACIGMDTSLAHFVLTAIVDPLIGVKEAMRLGIYATAIMKAHTFGVSGSSILFTYKKSERQWERHYAPEIMEIESRFPIADIQLILTQDWKQKNADIWTIVDGTPIRPSIS